METSAIAEEYEGLIKTCRYKAGKLLCDHYGTLLFVYGSSGTVRAEAYVLFSELV